MVETTEATVSEKILLDIPLLLQRPTLPTGCEIVSIAMMLDYNIIDVNPVQLAKGIPYKDNETSLGYVGNPFIESSWVIYLEALQNKVEEYLPTA